MRIDADARPTNDGTAARRRLPQVVWATGAVSFLTDLSTEMVYAVLPAFYRASLGFGAVWLGIIEGFAETTAALSKLLSGWWSDKTGGRKWWMAAGYGLSTLSKPLLPWASGGAEVLFLRGADRLGKGIRGAPRDALVAAEVPAGLRGRAFGVQRAMDHAGALSGSLLASVLLYFQWVTLPDLFLWTLLPGGLAVSVILFFVHERPAGQGGERLRARSESGFSVSFREQPQALRRYLLVLGLFALGNSSDALLLARAQDQLEAGGMAAFQAAALLPLLWGWLHVVKSLTSAWGGGLGDRIGRVRPLRWGWCLYAVVYAGFALWDGLAAPWILFAAYGVYYALVEGTEKAVIADLQQDATRRGSAYGLFHFVTGLAALPSSLLCGFLWQWGDRHWGAGYGCLLAFGLGATLALSAAVLLPRTLQIGKEKQPDGVWIGNGSRRWRG